MIQSHSILDKIIASQEDQAKQSFHPLEVISQLLSKLSTKEADVLQRRYGLNGAAKETLEAIGASYQVTRERIRQIENLAVKKMKADSNFYHLIRPIEHVVVAVLEEYGGIMNEEHLLSELFPIERTQATDQAMVFLLGDLMDDRCGQIGPDGDFMKSWSTKIVDLTLVKQTIQLLVQLIEHNSIPMDSVELFSKVQADQFYKIHADQLSEKAILSYLEVSAAVDCNPFNEYGLRKWGSVVPKRMNDKIYLILKKIGKPMHFVDIAKKISEVFQKEAYPPTVHNELILNSQYVLVGRGIYALKEWGYQSGVVSDVIVQILKQRQQPMTRDEIVDTVLKQRIVKKNTIHLALTNKAVFTKSADGRYSLA